MRLNTSKCHAMNLTQARSHKVISSYKLNHSNLTFVDHCKYLDVTIQNNLKWNQHVLNVYVKANHTLALLRRNLKRAPEGIKERAYLHLVIPQIEYASSVWCPWTKHNIITLEKVQRRAARFVKHDYGFTTSVSALINGLNWPSLEERRHQSQLLLLYKILHNHATIPIIDFLPNTSTAIHTRSHHDTKLYTPTPRTDIFKYSYFPSVIRLWNNLPQNIIDSSTVTEFKSLISNVPVIIN